MIILDSVNKTLEMVLAGAVATTQPDFVSTYVDLTTTSFTSKEQDGVGNSTTNVTIVSAPAASTQRQVKFVSITNKDTAAIVVTVNYNNNGTRRRVYKASLAVDYTLTYTDGDGWRVWTTSGALLTAPGSDILLSSRVTLTNAQMIALPTTAIAIVTAPVSGYQLRVLGATASFHIVTTGYTVDAGPSTLQIQHPAGDWVVLLAANNPFAGIPLTRLTDVLAVGDNLVTANGYSEAVESAAGDGDWGFVVPALTPKTNVNGTGLEIFLDNNGVGNLGGGNAANTGTFTVYYVLEQL